MLARIAAIDESFIDGTGIAYTIYFQGCSMRCPNCHNPELQNHLGGAEVDIEKIMEDFFLNLDLYDSVVFLGGEPLEQKEAVWNIIEMVSSKTDKPIWLYTGWEYEDIPKKILAGCDVVVAGPYIEELKTNSFPASKNQKIILRGVVVSEDQFNIRSWI